jgi:hemerythrin-like domain-containing protein
MKCTDLLIQDHKTILRALEILEEMANRVEDSQVVEQEDVEAILRFLRIFADDHHQAKEESALFPELMRAPCAQEHAFRQMLFEHDQERSLVEALEDALYTRHSEEFVFFARRFITLIRNHVRKEDDILFQFVDRCLTGEQDAKVVAEFNKYEIAAGIMADLERLEGKYLRKPALAR